MKKNKKYLLGLCLLLLPLTMLAQGDLSGALTEGTTQLKTISKNVISGIQIILAIGAIVSIALVFYKASKGDQDASDKAQSFFFALLFAAIALFVVQKLWLS
ncbi:MAG: DUF4134 family protein [Bacteroidales bacterium]